MKNLLHLSQDSYRFFLTFRRGIEQAPLQVYTSALLFSPSESCIKDLFKHEAPWWVVSQSYVDERWPSCVYTIEGLAGGARKTVFSSDGKRFISISDSDADIRDMITSAYLRKFDLKIPAFGFNIFDLSRDATKAAWAGPGTNNTIKVLDINTERWFDLPGYHPNTGSLVFSQNGQFLVSASRSDDLRRHGLYGCGAKIWELGSSRLLLELPHDSIIGKNCFPSGGPRLAATSKQGSIQIWDPFLKQVMQEIVGSGSIETLDE